MALVAVFLAFVVTVVFVLALRPVAHALGHVDMPGGRKRHGAPVPITGGIAMSIGLGFGSTLLEHPSFWSATLLGIYLLVAVGTIDDRFDLPANVRLIAQTCATLVLVFGADTVISHIGAPFFFEWRLGLASEVFTVLLILTLVNAFNVIDGIDGLAGGLALLSLAALAVIGFGTAIFPVAVLMLSVVAAFLVFNLPLGGANRKMRTFMGDAGSTSVGLAVASIGIVSSQGAAATMSPVVGLWLIAVPVFDLFAAIARRLLEGKSPFAPDHEHLHHVLIEHGLSRRATLMVMLVLAAFLAAIGVLADAFAIPDGVMMLGWLAAFVGYYQLMRRPMPIVRVWTGVGSLVGTAGRAGTRTSSNTAP